MQFGVMKQCPPAPLSPQLQENMVTVDSHTAGSKSTKHSMDAIHGYEHTVKKSPKTQFGFK